MMGRILAVVKLAARALRSLPRRLGHLARHGGKPGTEPAGSERDGLFKTLGVVLAAILLAALLLLLFPLAFIRSPFGAEDLCQVAQATIEDVSHQRVRIGRCSVDPIGTRVVLDKVEVGPPDRLFFAADRLAASVDHRGLFSGRLRIKSVDILRPRVEADLSSPASKRSTPQPRPAGAACLPDLSKLDIGQLTVTNGSFHLLLPQERGLALEGLGASLQGTGNQLSLVLHAKRTVLADADGATVATRTALEGDFDLSKGTARLDEVDVAGPEGSVVAHGVLNNICSMEGSADARLSLNFGLLHNHLLRRVPNLAGTATMEATARFKPPWFDAQFHADVHDLELLQFEPGDFSITAHATPDKVSASDVLVPMEGGQITADGAVDLKPPYQLEAKAKLKNFSLGEVLERVGAPGMPVHLIGSGTAGIKGPLAGHGGMRLGGNLDLKVAEFGVYNRSWRRRHARTAVRFVGFTKGTFKARVVLTPSQLEVQHGLIAAQGTELNVNGTVFFDVKKGLSLRVDAPNISAGALGPYDRVPVDGVGRLKGTITGPYQSLDIRAETRLVGTRVLHYELGEVAGSIDLDLAKGTLTATGVTGQKGASLYAGDGVLDFRRDVTLNARVSLDRARASDLMSIARPNFRWLGPLSENIDGILTGDVEISGRAARPTIATQMKLSAISLYGQRFDTGSIHARMKDARDIELSSCHLQRGVAEVNARGKLTFSSGAYDFSASSKNLTAPQVNLLSRSFPNLEGGLSFKVSGKGTLRHPSALGAFTIRQWFLNGAPVASAHVTMALKDDQLTARGEAVSPWPLDLPLPAQAPDAPLPRPPKSMVDAVTLSVQLHDDWPYQLNGQFDIPDASVLTRDGKLQGVQAAVTGKFDATGQLLHVLATTSADLTLSRLAVALNQRGVSNSEPVHARLKDGVLDFDRFHLNGTSFNLDASGTWTLVDSLGKLDLGGSKRIELHGDMDLGILRTLLPDLDFDDTRGDLALDLEASSHGGEALLASVHGTATLTDVLLRLRGSPIELTDGNGTVSCNFPIGRRPNGDVGVLDGQIRVEDVTARLNGAKASISGGVHVDEKMVRDANLRARLDPMRFMLGDLPVVVSGEPSFSRQIMSPQEATSVPMDERADTYVNVLGGDLKIDRFSYEQNLDLDRALVSVVNFSRRPPAPKVFEKAGEFLKLDMGISFGDVRIWNNLLKAKLDGDLRLTGTNRRPGLIGTVSFAEGKAHVRNVDYTVSSGVINFTDRFGFRRPTFDISADAAVSHLQTDYQIHVSATGTPQHPRLELSSSPVLSQADILTLLTIGVLSSDLEHGGATASLGGVFATTVFGATGIQDQVSKLLPSGGPLSDAQFHVGTDYIEQTGNIEPVAQIDLRVFNDRWKLRGQTSLLGPRGRKAELDVKLRKSLDGELEWDGDKLSAPSYGDFGGDLRWHWEKP